MNINAMPLKSFGHWILMKQLGEGAFGEVHHWKNHITNQEIATKRLKSNAKLKPDEINVLQKRWLLEFQWMKTLKTPHIVPAAEIQDFEFLNYLANQNHCQNKLPVIIMEYCNGGDLRGHLNKIENLNGLKEFEARNILHALCHATEYLHEQCKIQHRDIKPENIVIHVQGNRKFYKLADFGYAREIPESTIAQSVVGTRNYIAPEVVDPNYYTNTVDYWSIGNVAFEIITGIQPLLPHQTFVQRLKTIMKKPQECIAIVQKIDEPFADDFQFVNNIFPENHLTSNFREGIENWLRLSLDVNYKTRGCDCNNQLKFYSDLDEILNTKIVTVFSLKTYKKYYYDIETFVNVQQFMGKLSLDNDIKIENIFLISPTSHPKKKFENPIDFYVPEWCDTSQPENPPVMLFVAQFIMQRDFNIKAVEHFNVSGTIRKIMSMSGQNPNIPSWLLQQFERHVHFVVTNEQNLLECNLMGLHEYAMSIEHVMFLYEQEIASLNDRVSNLNGGVKLFNATVNEFMKYRGGEVVETAEEKAKAFLLEIENLESFLLNIKSWYKTILNDCKELAKTEIYEQHAKNDIFKLRQYREFISHVHSTVERLDEGLRVFEGCVSEFEKMNCPQNGFIKKLRYPIDDQINKFNCCRKAVAKKNYDISELEKELENVNRTLVRQIVGNDDSLSLKMNSLQIDGETSNFNSDIFDTETAVLMEESHKLINDMKSTMEIDEDIPLSNDDIKQ